MKYVFNQRHHTDFSVFEINKRKPRAYAIPYSDGEKLRTADIVKERYGSDRIIMLSGEWNFKYYGSCFKLPSVFDTDAEKTDRITVPSTWQRTGYENPNYLNTRYQFPLLPPHIPKDMPVSVYIKRFTENISDGKTYLLNFLGVCACFDLFVNGQFVGYSEGSHNTAEFDITGFMKDGGNEIVAKVYKWCNGSYLECQDMFRENGIFRDVFIIKEGKSFVNDFGYSTKYLGGKDYKFEVDCSIENPLPDSRAEFILYDKNGAAVLSDVLFADGAKKEYIIKNADEWSAEIPNLYTLIIKYTANGDTVYYRAFAGFKHIEIKGSVFYFNNQKVKFKGVNQHETHPKTGFVVSAEFLENDIKLLKAYNANAVRLSHYIHDPIFLKLCDKYGLYAIDEMDLEAHGVYSNPLRSDFGMISEKLVWKNHFLDRAHRMFYRDRNEVCVVMWSLGNESGGDKCHDACYDFLKSVSDIPVHYEGAIHTKRFNYDVTAEFYPDVRHLEGIVNGTVKDKRYLEKPYFMSEYAHAMGVGPGGLERYMQYVLNNDIFCGGCIWEFCDHIVDNPDAPHRFTYGGDYGEKKHDGNFCVDGLFFPDRTPSTGALTMREAYRPIRAEYKNGKIGLFNTNYFLDTSPYRFFYSLIKDGIEIGGGELKDINIGPMEKIAVDIPTVDMNENADYFIRIEYRTLNGGYVAREEFCIKRAEKHARSYKKPDYTDNCTAIEINFDGGRLIISKKDGSIISYKSKGVELINQKPLLGVKGLLPNMYRVPIDNDRFIKVLWKSLGLLTAKPVHLKTKTVDGGELKVISRYAIRGLGRLATAELELKVGADGGIFIAARLKRGWKLLSYSEITRFGITLEMPKEFSDVTYYGLGDRETLSDFSLHGFTGIYSKKVSEMHEPYIMPQESGNRTEVRWATVTNEAGRGIKIEYIDNYLNFNANHYTRYQLAACTHSDELKEYDTTAVQVDGFMRGTGSQSCGPKPTPEHIVTLKKPLEFGFYIKPL